jgi:hypothetical protein
MKRVNWIGLFAIVSFLAMGSPLRGQDQGKSEAIRASQAQEKDYYTCQMHPEVKSDKPGKCPECGMNLVLASTLEKQQHTSEQKSGKLNGKEKALKARALLAEAKEELYYNCCMKNPCDRCALDHQSCSCYSDLQKGEAICSDCYAGWQRGEGKDIKGITKEKVKLDSHGHKH